MTQVHCMQFHQERTPRSAGHAPLVAELVGHAIGVFTNLAADDPEAQARIGAFLQGLQQSGWTVGSNVRIDYRWGTTDYARYHQYAAELVALGPDALLCVAGAALTALQHRADRIRWSHRPGRRRPGCEFGP